MIDNNLPVMANSKVNNHCSILISIDLYALDVTKNECIIDKNNTTRILIIYSVAKMNRRHLLVVVSLLF